MDLNKFTLEELQAEIDRREKIYRFDFKGEVFELTMTEIQTLQAELNKINPPINPMDEYRKIFEKARVDPWRTDQPKPWMTEPIYPGNPWQTGPYHDPNPKIWCGQVSG